MEALYYFNFLVWSSVVVGIMWATHSRHIIDGILIKIGLASLAMGAAANAVEPCFNSQLWIGGSMLSIFIFFLVRLCQAKITGKKSEFLSF